MAKIAEAKSLYCVTLKILIFALSPCGWQYKPIFRL